jgi:large subunit ribosomal protein L9
MQIILLEKVQNVGDLGEVVKVRQGYARNFLIPQGKAKRATPENLKLLEEKRSELEKAAGEKLAKAQVQAEKLEGVTIQVTQKAGVDGRLFGSVTNVDIVDALQGLGHTGYGIYWSSV